MNTPAQQPTNGPGVFVIIGILMAVGFVVWMLKDNTSGVLPSDDQLPASADVVHLTAANWQKEVMDSKVPVVVDFWAPWCGPCLKLGPTINKLATTYAGRVKVGKLNVDEAKTIAARYGIDSIPRVFVFKGGSLATTPIEGVVSEEELTQVIDGVLQKL